MKRLCMGIIGLIVLLGTCTVFGSTDASVPARGVNIVQPSAAQYVLGTVVVAMLGLSLAVSMCGMAQGKAITAAIESIARQPETASKIQLILMIGLAFIESLVLYTLFVSIILLFVNPFIKYVF